LAKSVRNELVSMFSALALRCSITGGAGVYSRGARLSDAFKNTLLKSHLALNGINKIWNEVVPALELHLDLAQCLINTVAPIHESVKGRDPNECKYSNDYENWQ